MVKVYRCNQIIYKDRYYIWTYRPKEYWKLADRITEKNLYKKHVCGIGYFTRYHAKHTAIFLHGVDTLSYIHIIKGSKLLKQGITRLPFKYSTFMFFKGHPAKLHKWVMPPEYKMDKHRRRYFIVRMNRCFRLYGKKGFNELYKWYQYGHRQGFSEEYLKQKRRECNISVLQEILQDEQQRKENLQCQQG